MKQVGWDFEKNEKEVKKDYDAGKDPLQYAVKNKALQEMKEDFIKHPNLVNQYSQEYKWFVEADGRSVSQKE